MAEGKQVELSFNIFDHIKNKRITDGTFKLFIFENNGNNKNKKYIQNIKLTNTDKPTTVKVDIQYVRQRVYIELENSGYRTTPFPNPYVSTIILLFMRHGLIRTVRFVPKEFYIGIVKAYSKRLCLNSKQSDYLLNWRNETISIAKDQEITLKAYIMYDKDNIRNFIEASDYEESISNQVHWAFTISKDIFSYKTVDNRNNLNTISATLTLNNTQDGDIRKFSAITQIDNSINNVYKIMRAGEEVTGHTINFSLSDIFSDTLLKNELFRETYYITFFAYEIEEEGKIVITYNKTTDNLPLKQLKIVNNKYSMVLDVYHLELYKNGKYVDSFNIEYSNIINLILKNQLKHNVDINNIYYFKYSSHIQHDYLMSDMLLDKINLIPYENKVNIGMLYDQSDKYNYTVHNQSCSNEEYERQLYFNNAKSTNNSSSLDQADSKMFSIYLSRDAYESLMSKIYQETDILVKYFTKPKYVIEVTRYKEVYNSNKSIQHMKERYGATYGVFAVYVYYNGEKFLLDSVIDAYNGEQKNNKDKVIDKDNIISTHIETINSFVNNHKNHHSIKTDMYKKNLQNKANYGNLIYGGYTMEPAGPDNITEEVKRRIPEGHYKGIYHKYSRKHYKRNTMNLYSDMVRYKRYILVHAGGQNIAFTTGCILVSTDSYETGNIYNSKDLNDDKDYNTSTMKILKRLDNLYKALYKHNIKKTLGADNDISSCISLVIRNQMNRG